MLPSMQPFLSWFKVIPCLPAFMFFELVRVYKHSLYLGLECFQKSKSQCIVRIESSSKFDILCFHEIVATLGFNSILMTFF